MQHSSAYHCQCAVAIFYRFTVSSTIQQFFTYKIFRVLFRIFFIFLCLGDWHTTLAQQHLPSATVLDSEKQSSQLGKNHLNGIRRLSIASQEDTWEHRHLRHIPSPMEPIKSPRTLNNQMVINGGGEPRPPIAQQLPKVPLKEIPSPVLEEFNEQTVFDLSSTEAEALAKKLLQNAGIEQELASRDEQQQATHQRTSWENKESSTERKNKLSRPALSSPALHSEEDDSNFMDGEGRKTMERIRSRWRKIGPLLKTNTSSLIPLRRLRLVQHRRKLQKDSRQRLQSKISLPLPSPPTPHPQHAATVERATNVSKSAEITKKSPLSPNSITKIPMAAPRAHQMAVGYSAEQHQIANESGQRQQQQELVKEIQKPRQQLNKQHPKDWKPAERMLRHRHRIRFEQQQHRKRQRRPPIFNGPLLSGVVENGASATNGQQRQYGLKTELREGQRGNRLEELLAEEEQLTKPEDSLGTKSTEPHNNRRPVQARFRLVPNKVIFRPRLKIRRPPGNPESVGANSVTVARGTDQQIGGQQPIAIPSSLSTFQSASDSVVQPIPIPPTLEEPPLRVASPSPSMTETIEPIATPPPPSPPTSIPPSIQPLPALEIGSIGEQPPQNIQGGPPTMSSPETTTTTTKVPNSTQPTPAGNVGTDVLLLGESAAGSGLIGNSPETEILPPGFSDGSGFIGGAGGGDNGLAFGAELGTPPPGFKEAFGLNGFETSIGSFGAETTTPFISSTTITQPSTISTTQIQTTTTTQLLTTTSTPMPPPTTTIPIITSPPPSPRVEEVFIIPENSGLRPVSPPKEFQGSGGFGSHGTVVSSSGGGGNGFGGGGGRLEPPPPNAQVEPPQQPLKPEDFFTGESAFQPNKRGPEGDGYGPSVLPGAPIPPAPAGPAIGVGGAAAGIPLPPFRPLPNAIGGGAAAPEQPVENEATTVKPSALLNFLNKADEGFNQVITHFERGTPLEAAAIDIMEVALGSQKLDSQAKLLSHVDRAIGLDNLQRLQRWANTGGAFDLIKEQFAKIAKNYKPPPETANLFTVPPQLEYLFQPGSSSGKRRKRR